MFRTHPFLSKCAVISGMAFASLASPQGASAQSKFIVLYSFTGGSDGGASAAPLISDESGNLYGTTEEGGTGCNGIGCGTVFELAPDGTETVPYAFTGGANGDNPLAGLMLNKNGTLYGTTYGGGAGCRRVGCGTVFALGPGGGQTVLFTLTKKSGANPYSNLIPDKAGNLYGTTSDDGKYGVGTVFKLAPDGTLRRLHVFTGGNDGGFPQAGLLRDKAGNLYGTAVTGGANQQGVVFKLAPDRTETVLYSFHGETDGFGPDAALIEDEAGNLYSTTFKGGGQDFSGTVFKLAPDGTETVLYSFTGGNDGQYPDSSLLMDRNDNLYGTTYLGGAYGYGTVFKLAPDGTETVLHAFTDGKDGAYPFSGVIADRTGTLYGTTSEGGANLTQCGNVGCGTVFAVKK